MSLRYSSVTKAAPSTRPYEKIIDHLRARLDRGDLVVGEALPPIRQLARDHQVSPATALRAVRELIDCGLLARRRGPGIVVRATTMGATPRQLALTRGRAPGAS